MKYYKLTDLTTNELHHVSARCATENKTLADLALLDPRHEYKVEEISSREYFTSLFAGSHDPDVEDDWEDTDDEYYD
jgi:hypothetical protein